MPTPGGFWEEHTPPSDLAPGATEQFAVGFSYECSSSVQPPVYRSVTVTLPGGGTFTQILRGTQPNSQVPLGVSAQCGVTVSELVLSTPPQPGYPSDPLAVLSSSIQAPSTLRSGQVINYVITLSNPTASAIALDPCRGYYQTIDAAKSPFFSYELNCRDAQPIPANGSERFVMEMPTSGISPGAHNLCWQLDLGAASRPPSCASIEVAA